MAGEVNAGRGDRAARGLLAAMLAATTLYGLLLVLLPAALPSRPVISDVTFVPFHPLAALMLWRVASASTGARRRAFSLLALSQAVGIVNTLVWVLSDIGYIGTNAPAFQYVGIIMTVLSVAGVVYLVPRRGIAGNIVVVPLVDASLLALASLAVGWQFVGAPLLQLGRDSATDFLGFVVLTAADTFTALFALGAWAFPSDRIRPRSALLLALAFGMSAWLDVLIETGTANQSYESGHPIDVAFAIAIALMGVVSYLERRPAVDHPVGTAGRAALARLLLPFVAATAVVVPVLAQAARPMAGLARFVPWLLLLLFIGLVQWRYVLLERTAERVLTERLAVERDLRLSQQFESLGRYAASVAHDMNNLLAALLAQVQLVRYLNSDSLAAVPDERLAEMERTLGSGTTLVRRLSQMSRGSDTPSATVDLTRAARNMAITIGRLLPTSVHLTLDLAADPVLVTLHPGDIDQLLLNLVVNARDALEEGGNIGVRIRADGRHAELEVSDDGSGISPEIVSRIFDPFFTTRVNQGGTGLGLATVQAIVTQSGGTVDVSSSPERGTRFTVRWPAVTSTD